MLEQVIAILSEFTEVPAGEIAGSSSLVGDLGISSLDIVGLLSELEEKYHLNLDDCEMGDFQTVNDVVAFLARTTGQEAGAPHPA